MLFASFYFTTNANINGQSPRTKTETAFVGGLDSTGEAIVAVEKSYHYPQLPSTGVSVSSRGSKRTWTDRRFVLRALPVHLLTTP